MIGPSERPDVCEFPSVPIKPTGVIIELIEGLQTALEHRNAASTRSRTIDPSLERSSLALLHMSTQTRKS